MGKPEIAMACMKSCGLCTGMEPHNSTICYDKSNECIELAETLCWNVELKESCKKSCGLCIGMTPHNSTTCYDMADRCVELAETLCWNEDVQDACKKSCGLCTGMTPIIPLFVMTSLRSAQIWLK